MKNMKMMTAAEMEKINGGHRPGNDPFEITLEKVRRTERPFDPDFFEHGIPQRWEFPDMIDPELLRELTKQLQGIDNLQ